MRLRLAILLVVAGVQFSICGQTQENASLDSAVRVDDSSKSEPKYDQTFSGSIVEVSQIQLTVSRSILGKPAEKRTFSIKTDTRIEGKLRVRARVTVGYVQSDDGDVARLVVVRSSQQQKPPEKK